MRSEETPEGFRTWNREERLSWYERRVRKYLPAYEFIEEIVSDKSIEEVTSELRGIRSEILQLETQIFILESSSLSNMRTLLDEAIVVVKQARKNKINLLISNLRQTDTDALVEMDNQLRKAIAAADLIEVELMALCDANKVDPSPYLKLKYLMTR